MKGGDEDMEAIITMQHDDESIRTKNNQFMEDIIENDFKQLPN
jgi:hypothetical protein